MKRYKKKFIESVTKVLTNEIEAWTGAREGLDSVIIPARTKIKIVSIGKGEYGDQITYFIANGKNYKAYSDVVNTN